MFENNQICPRCQTGRLKNWNELTGDEIFIAERMPASSEFSARERLTHLFCPHCWFETKPSEEKA